MALELPPELQPVLGLLGVEWPDVNEDELNRFADELRKLASAIDSTQMAADKAVSKLGEVYHGASADQLTQAWGAVSKFSGLVVEACGITANALSAAALVVEMCKGGAIAQLTVTSGSLATAAVTAPWTTPAILAAGKQIVSQVLESAVTEIGHALAQPIGDLVETAAKTVLGSLGGGSAGSVGQGFGVDLGQLASCALELRGHADDVDSSGSAFKQIFDTMDIGQPNEIIGKVVTEAAEQIATTVGTEVVKRLLSSLHGTADGMDQVGKNLAANEDSHTQMMSKLLAEPSPSATSPRLIKGSLSAPDSTGGGSSVDHTGIDSFHPQVDGADVSSGGDPTVVQPVGTLQPGQSGAPGSSSDTGRLSPGVTADPGSLTRAAAGQAGTARGPASVGSATAAASGRAGSGKAGSTAAGRSSQSGGQVRAAMVKQNGRKRDEEERPARTRDLPVDPTAEDPDAEK
ncbi:hypothetical protein ABT095_36555 [Kitasatospora sp. NPDC002227]|uniref:WXG100-like domain-containing protein n=1 Tax=Kitasatospora sp. NPDC002227 TaxID=3154773 RepID=UPI003331F569